MAKMLVPIWSQWGFVPEGSPSGSCDIPFLPSGENEGPCRHAQCHGYRESYVDPCVQVVSRLEGQRSAHERVDACYRPAQEESCERVLPLFFEFFPEVVLLVYRACSSFPCCSDSTDRVASERLALSVFLAAARRRCTLLGVWYVEPDFGIALGPSVRPAALGFLPGFAAFLFGLLPGFAAVLLGLVAAAYIGADRVSEDVRELVFGAGSIILS